MKDFPDDRKARSSRTRVKESETTTTHSLPQRIPHDHEQLYSFSGVASMRVCIGQWSGLDATDGILFVECTLTNRFLLIRGLFADYNYLMLNQNLFGALKQWFTLYGIQHLHLPSLYFLIRNGSYH